MDTISLAGRGDVVATTLEAATRPCCCEAMRRRIQHSQPVFPRTRPEQSADPHHHYYVDTYEGQRVEGGPFFFTSSRVCEEEQGWAEHLQR